jgi:hypothetical protein
MSLPSGRTRRPSLAIAVAAYAVGAIVAGLGAAHALQRLGIAVLDGLAPFTADAARVRRESAPAPTSDAATVPARTGAVRVAAGPQFGASSRNAAHPYDRRQREDDDEREPLQAATYRTLCVRLCDGYYFPISFAAPADRLERDGAICASRCGGQGRLFVHASPGGSVEEAEDLQGRPYRQLRTAFRYRTEYVPGCKCQPHPWEADARDRHRGYLLAAAARRGSRDAARELRALQAKTREASKAPERGRGTITPPVPVEVTRSHAAAESAPSESGRQAEIAAREGGGNLMRLGGSGAPKAAPERLPQRALPEAWRERDPGWMRRAFEPGQGG